MQADAGAALAILVIGVAAGAIGAMVGGGSLLSIPLLIFLGLPPQIAIATDRFAGLGAGATSLYQFWRADRIVWRYVPVLALASLAGSLIGASALVRLEPGSLRLAVGVLLVALVPLLFVRRDLGVVARDVSGNRVAWGLGLYFGVQVMAGFFGGGTGVLIFFILMSFFGVTMTQVAATQILPFLVLSVSSLLLFAARDLIDYRAGLVLMLGAAVGGYLGAHIAIRKGDRWVRRLFACVLLASAARLLFP